MQTLLSSGAYGCVYSLDKERVVKRLENHTDYPPLNELDIMRRLSQYPNFAKLLDFSPYPNFSLTMQRAKWSLLDHLEVRDTMSSDQAKECGLQVLSCLDILHREGYLHLDIYPTNVLVFETSHGLKFALSDFGLSKPRGQFLTLEEQLPTRPYHPPEFLFPPRRVSEKSDIWAYGCLLFHIVSGRHAFSCEFLEQLQSIQEIERVEEKVKEELEERLRFIPNAKFRNLLRRILHPNPNLRPTIHQIMQDPFFHQSPSAESLEEKNLPCSSFEHKKEWKKTLSRVELRVRRHRLEAWFSYRALFFALDLLLRLPEEYQSPDGFDACFYLAVEYVLIALFPPELREINPQLDKNLVVAIGNYVSQNFTPIYQPHLETLFDSAGIQLDYKTFEKILIVLEQAESPLTYHQVYERVTA